MRQINNTGVFGIQQIGIPAWNIPVDGVAYDIAQEVDPSDLIRAEIYPGGQNVTMTENTVPTFGPGTTLVIWRLWKNGILKFPYYISTALGLTYSAGNIVRIRRDQ